MLFGLTMLYLAAKPSHMGANVDRNSVPPAPSYHLAMTHVDRASLPPALSYYLWMID
jgi:hypothetical protein